MKETLKEYLHRRGVRSYNPLILDEESDTCFFLLYDILGRLIGYQRHNRFAPKIHANRAEDYVYYYTYKSYKIETIYGLESLGMSDEVYIVEGIFDACRLHTCGKSALALMSSNPLNATSFLKFLRLKHKIIAICDGDKAGLDLIKFADSYILLDDGKDANDYSIDELTQILEKHNVG